MWFNVKKARTFLLENGFIFTLRPKAPRLRNKYRGFDILMYDGFGKKGKIFFCHIQTVDHPIDLQRYVKYSGFEAIDYWWIAAKTNRELYLVVLLEPQ